MLGLGVLTLMLCVFEIKFADVFVLAAICSFIASWFAFSSRRFQLTTEEKQELQTLEGTDHWVVNIRIIQDGTITGADRGYLWIESGKLHFSGTYTSFSMGRECIDYLPNHFPEIWGLSYKTTIAIKKPGGGLMYLSLDEVGETRTPIFYRANRNIVKPELITLIRDRLLHLSGQLPPIEDGPGVPSFSSMIAYLVVDVIGDIYLYLLLGVQIMRVLSLSGTSVSPIWLLASLLALPFGNVPRRVRSIVGRLKRNRQKQRKALI